MYVDPDARRRGVGRAILRALEDRARDFGYTRLQLETGARQPEAITLYESAGYLPIEPYGYYRDSPLNRCFEKALDPLDEEWGGAGYSGAAEQRGEC